MDEDGVPASLTIGVQDGLVILALSWGHGLVCNFELAPDEAREMCNSLARRSWRLRKQG